MIWFLIAVLIILPMFWLNWGGRLDLSPYEEALIVAFKLLAVVLLCGALVYSCAVISIATEVTP